MRIFMLSNPNAVHTRRWVKALAERDITIMLYSFRPYEDDGYYKRIDRVQLKSFSSERDLRGIKNFFPVKLFTYYRALLRDIKKSIRSFQPDIVHAHYLADNGLFGALSGFHPFVVSAWGTDIYDYPRRSGSRACVIRYVLKKADCLLSTSHVMAKEVFKYTNKEWLFVTPFGVDMSLFKPLPVERPGDNHVVFGIVKTLKYGYGIDTLIDAFALLRERRPDLSIELRIVGDGPERDRLRQRVTDLGISREVSFAGRIENDKLPGIINQFDIFVALSRTESFGVAVVEAMATGRPVIVSDAPGFTEIVEHGVSGLIVRRDDPHQASAAMETLVDDGILRRTLAENGRERVRALYDWNKNVEEMIAVYESISMSKHV